MVGINCNNSSHKSVVFFNNGGTSILAYALQDGEFWFTIGGYKTLTNAKRSAIKAMGVLGYTFDESQMEKLTIE